MPEPGPVPATAIQAAAKVLYSRFARLTHTSGNEMLRMQDAAQAALDAAWPLLAEQATRTGRERLFDRIRELAEKVGAAWWCDPDDNGISEGVSFAQVLDSQRADLLGGTEGNDHD
jgi:hypothetical protein